MGPTIETPGLMSPPDCPICGSTESGVTSGLTTLSTKLLRTWKTCAQCGHTWAASSVTGGGTETYDQSYYRVRSASFSLKGFRTYPAVSLKGQGDTMTWVASTGVSAHLLTWLLLRRKMPYSNERFRALEIGSASGQFLRTLKESNPNSICVAAEFSAAGALASSRAGLSVVRCDAHAPPFREGVFDVILLNHVLEHLRYPAQSLTALRQLLSPTGVIIGIVPWKRSLPAKLFMANWSMAADPTHLHFFSRRSFDEITARAGMQLRSTNQRQSPWNLLPTPLTGNTSEKRTPAPHRYRAWGVYPIAVVCTLFGIGDEFDFVLGMKAD
jgi:SAM-dependent methyltransferase